MKSAVQILNSFSTSRADNGKTAVELQITQDLHVDLLDVGRYRAEATGCFHGIHQYLVASHFKLQILITMTFEPTS